MVFDIGAASQTLRAVTENMAPWMIQSPLGASMGPIMICPPPDLIADAAASMSATRK